MKQKYEILTKIERYESMPGLEYVLLFRNNETNECDILIRKECMHLLKKYGVKYDNTELDSINVGDILDYKPCRNVGIPCMVEKIIIPLTNQKIINEYRNDDVKLFSNIGKTIIHVNENLISKVVELEVYSNKIFEGEQFSYINSYYFEKINYMTNFIKSINELTTIDDKKGFELQKMFANCKLALEGGHYHMQNNVDYIVETTLLYI